MSSNLWKREIYVALHGQTKKFRIVKWIILIILFSVIYWKFGGVVLAKTVGILGVLGVLLHLFFRWKTKAWSKSWGPYKYIKIPEDL